MFREGEGSLLYFDIDQKFLEHFKNLKQVFLYIINYCNLKCPHCIYKPNNQFTIGEIEIPLETAYRLLSDFHEMGARKLTLLGGEPTLYGTVNGQKEQIAEVIEMAGTIGYEYVRIDTNGIFDSSLLHNDKFKKVSEISFSLDGYDERSNDRIRGPGSFKKSIAGIKAAVELGYKVDLTCCVYDELLEKQGGEYALEKMIVLAEDHGVNRINFHSLIKDGTAIDTWSGDLEVEPGKWVRVYEAISENIKNNKYKIPVRIPRAFITAAEFDDNPAYYGYCPAKLGERVLVHPDGIIRICSGLLGTAYGIADYYRNQIVWNDRKTNELIDHQFNKNTPCTNRGKKSYGDLVPLCFSFKPRQDEFVYKDLLNWESRNRKK